MILTIVWERFFSFHFSPQTIDHADDGGLEVLHCAADTLCRTGLNWPYNKILNAIFTGWLASNVREVKFVYVYVFSFTIFIFC